MLGQSQCLAAPSFRLTDCAQVADELMARFSAAIEAARDANWRMATRNLILVDDILKSLKPAVPLHDAGAMRNRRRAERERSQQVGAATCALCVCVPGLCDRARPVVQDEKPWQQEQRSHSQEKQRTPLLDKSRPGQCRTLTHHLAMSVAVGWCWPGC